MVDTPSESFEEIRCGSLPSPIFRIIRIVKGEPRHPLFQNSVVVGCEQVYGQGDDLQY